MCLYNTYYLPAVLLSEFEVHRRLKRSIDHKGLAVGPDDVRESPFAGASQLEDSRFAPFASWHLCNVPGEAPGLHSSLKRRSIIALGSELLGRDEAGLPCTTDGYHRLLAG